MGYDNKAIADELQRTAQGESYYGNALWVDRDIPSMTEEEKAILDAYLTGHYARIADASFRLQDIAIKIWNLKD